MKKYSLGLLLACVVVFGAHAQPYPAPIDEAQIKQFMAEHDIAPNATFFRQASSSMEPSIPVNTILVVQPYPEHTLPMRGDLIVFTPPTQPEASYIKRVVAIAGDRVQFKQGGLILNGVAQHEPYAFVRDKAFIQKALKNPKYPQNFFNSQVLTVPENSFFVLGDNRFNSSDSRVFGAINLSAIKGQALLWKDLAIDDPRRGEFLRTRLKRMTNQLPLDLGDGVLLTSLDVLDNHKIQVHYALPAAQYHPDIEQYLKNSPYFLELYCDPRYFGGLTGVGLSQVFTFEGVQKPVVVDLVPGTCAKRPPVGVL